MNDAQQEMSPDFVLMRLVSAAKYDRLDEPDDPRSGGGGFGRVKSALVHHSGVFDLDPSGPPAGLGSSSPHYSSPLPGGGELDAGLVLTQTAPGSEAPLAPPPAEDFAAAAQRFVDLQNGSGGHGSRAQLMVFQKLLRSGDRILECGLDHPPPGFLLEETERKRQELDSGSCPGPDSTPVPHGTAGVKNPIVRCGPPAEEPQILPWHPILQLSGGFDPSRPPQQTAADESGPVLCHRHRLLTDRLVPWPPGLLDQALHLGLLEPQKNCPNDPVLSLAQRMGQLGEAREDRGGKGAEMGLLRCSCHSVLASGSVGPGEDPTETSDALLVLEGLGSGEGGEDEGGGSGDKGDTQGDVGGTAWGAGPGFSSGTLSGLMRQVHRLAEEAGVCTDQNCRSPLAIFGGAMSLPPCADSHPPVSSPPVHTQTPPAAAASTVLPTSQSPPSEPGSRPQSLSQPQSRATTPKLVPGAAGRSASPLLVLERDVGGGKEGEKASRGKSRKGGSLKVRLSKLFRTKSSSGGSGGLLDKRPSLASSTSSGGSLLDVWGSTCSSGEQDSSR